MLTLIPLFQTRWPAIKRLIASLEYISIKSDNENSEISIEDDGPGYPKDILNKIGQPYIKSSTKFSSKIGLGLGIFIGKTLLEKNFASLNCRNSKTRTGAEVIIRWSNKDLLIL